MDDTLTPETAPLVRIDWNDIAFDDKWNSDEGLTQPYECMTVGFLIDETTTTVTVASSYNYRDNAWATIHSFPKSDPVIKQIKRSKK